MSYHHHNFSDPRHFIGEIPKDNNYDRKEMIHELKPLAFILIKEGVYEIVQFNRFFKEYGFNSKETGKLLRYLIEKISPEVLPSQRSISKSNFSEKNLIFNYIALVSGDNFTEILKNYLDLFYRNLLRKDDFIEGFLKLNNEVIQRSTCKEEISINTNTDSEVDISVINSMSDDLSSESPSEATFIQTSKRIKLPGIATFDFPFDIY